jgi:hypothetical protein
VATECSDSDFTDTLCSCCPNETPKYSDGICQTCADIDITKPVYNSATKVCEACPTDTPLWNGSSCEACPNECQIYDATSNMCVAKTDGVACTNGLCKAGVCTNDTCTTGQKSCASGMTATKVGTTVYGTNCYTCACPANYTLSNGTCVPNSCSYNTCTGTYFCLTNKTATSSCGAPSGGVCTAPSYRTVTASGKTYYVSNREFTYWDAVSFCRSLGKSLIEPSDLASDYVSGYENYMVTLKPLATAVKNLGIRDYLWTSQQGSVYGTSCYRVGIGSANATVYEWNIRANDRQDYAVCK